MKTLLTAPVVAVLLFAFACPAKNLDKNARDTAAALGGLLTSAQSQHLDECRSDPTGHTCVLINRAGAAQNALITAEETFCGFQLTPSLPPPETACAPVSSAGSALQSAIANANQFIGELKGTVGK